MPYAVIRLSLRSCLFTCLLEAAAFLRACDMGAVALRVFFEHDREAALGAGFFHGHVPAGEVAVRVLAAAVEEFPAP